MAEGEHLRLDSEVTALALGCPSAAKHLRLCLIRQGFCWGSHAWQEHHPH